mmetsp:Transcript_5446/g.9734  ORF Transcript_5446/g.9734 Transcript_5446/m.9734 type:complete len:229 (+) Transcript_5446:78-764(+)
MHVALLAFAVACESARDPEQNRFQPSALVQTGPSFSSFSDSQASRRSGVEEALWVENVSQTNAEESKEANKPSGVVHQEGREESGENAEEPEEPETEDDEDEDDVDEEDMDEENTERYQDLPSLNDESFKRYTELSAEDGPVSAAIKAADTAAAQVKESAVVWKLTEKGLQKAADDVNKATQKSQEDMQRGDRILYDMKGKPARQVKKEVEENLHRMKEEAGDRSVAE